MGRVVRFPPQSLNQQTIIHYGLTGGGFHLSMCYVSAQQRPKQTADFRRGGLK